MRIMAHILYVNGEYRDDSAIGRLMHDFNCTNAEDMHYKLLAEKTRYLKENPKGVSEMCKVMEELREESFAEGREEGRAEGREEGRAEGREEGRGEQARMTAVRMSKKGLSVEEIADAVDFSVETVKKWLASEKLEK